MNIYDRYLENKEGPEPVMIAKTKFQLPQVSRRDWIYIAVIIIALIAFAYKYIQHGRAMEKAQELERNREMMIDLRFRESVQQQEIICQQEQENQQLLERIDEILKYEPYVKIRKQYIDLTLPDAIDTFDGTDYPE